MVKIQPADMVAILTQYLSVNEKALEGEKQEKLEKQYRFAALTSLAKTHLTANASSVPCESMSLISGMLLNGRRSSLVPHTTDLFPFVTIFINNFYAT